MGMSRAALLRRGAVGSGALLVSASGLAALAPVASADDASGRRPRVSAPAGRCGAARGSTSRPARSASGKLRNQAVHALFRRIRTDEKAHYTQLAALLTAAGQTPAAPGDIDFSYPKGSLRSQRSIVTLAGRLEHLMVGAYVGAIEIVQTPELRLTIGRIAANEAQHQGALAGLRGDSVVGAALAPALQIGAVSDALDEFES